MLHLIARRIVLCQAISQPLVLLTFRQWQNVHDDPVALPLGLWIACSQRHVLGLQRSMIRSGLAGGNLAGQNVIQMLRDDPGQLSTRTEAFGLVY